MARVRVLTVCVPYILCFAVNRRLPMLRERFCTSPSLCTTSKMPSPTSLNLALKSLKYSKVFTVQLKA